MQANVYVYLTYTHTMPCRRKSLNISLLASGSHLILSTAVGDNYKDNLTLKPFELFETPAGHS